MLASGSSTIREVGATPAPWWQDEASDTALT